MSGVTIATIIFCMVGISIGGWFYSLSQLLARLRTVHPAEYETLGRPTVWSRNTPATRRATMEFLVSGRHKALGDAQLAHLGRMTLVWLCAVAVTGVIAMVLACIFPPG